jgi:hypothetical protein
MAYKKAEMIEQCLRVIRKHKLTFVEDIIALVPFTKKTFYARKLHECNAIKQEIESNKITMKRGLRAKWFNGDNPTAQIALYRLLADEHELDRLTVSKQRVEMMREQPLFPEDNKPTDYTDKPAEK